MLVVDGRCRVIDAPNCLKLPPLLAGFSVAPDVDLMDPKIRFNAIKIKGGLNGL